MFNRDRWQEIFEIIRKNKLRTFFRVCSPRNTHLYHLIWVWQWVKNTFQEFFLDDATNTLFLFAGKTSKPYKGFKANRIEFENEDLSDIKDNFSFFLEYITPRISRGASVRYNNEFDNYTTRAVGPDHQYAENDDHEGALCE